MSNVLDFYAKLKANDEIYHMSISLREQNEATALPLYALAPYNKMS